MGKAKVFTIVRLLTYLHENPNAFSELDEQGAEHKEGNLPHVLLDKNPEDWKSIAISEWSRICHSIPEKFHQEPIERFANDMGIYWPAKKGWETWKVEDVLKNSYAELAGTKNLGRVRLETIVRVLIHLTIPQDVESGGSELEECSRDKANAIWEHPVIAGLDTREQQVFETRLLTVYDKPTLDAIGQQYGVTRERIRQVQSAILKKIAASGLETELKKILKHFKEQKLLKVYSKRRYLLRSEVPDIVDSFDQELVLAIALSHKSIYHLLCSIAVETPSGWYFGKRSDLQRLAKTLKRELHQLLPAPTCQLSEFFGVPREDLIACSLLKKFAFPSGALLLPHGSGRADATRAAECFEKAVSEDRRFWSIDELIEVTTGELKHNDQRLYRLSISRCNRLFLSTPAYVTVLDHSIDLKLDDTTPNEEIEDPGDDPQDEDPERGSAAVLQRILDEQWPITGTNIIEFTGRPEYQTHLSDNSLIPLLVSIPGCIRIAPGVYAPKSFAENQSRLKESRKLILREADIWAYCFARWSGENCAEIFPLWDAEQEQLWYRKLRNKGEDDPLLRSFVSIADQSKWPEQSNSEKLELMELSITAKFLIKPSWIQNRSFNLPDLATTLTALRYVKDIGPLSWIRVNHITGVWKLTEESGLSVLMCGLALGLLDTKRRSWWEAIPASNDFDEKWNNIQSIFIEPELPDWNHPVIQEYFESARELAADKKLGFIKLESLDEFIHTLRTRTD